MDTLLRLYLGDPGSNPAGGETNCECVFGPELVEWWWEITVHLPCK